MAIRLNVLILKPAGAVESRFEDAVGQLLGRPGIDVVMLERLPSRESDSTEGLALQSLSGTFACLAWEDPELVMSRLAAAGKPSIRRAHQRDVNPPNIDVEAGQADSVFFYDMRDERGAGAVLNDLQALLQTLRVPTFSLNLGASPIKTDRAGSKQNRVSSEPSVTQRPTHVVAIRSSDSKPPTKAGSLEDTASKVETSRSLDQLVNDLDEMDL